MNDTRHGDGRRPTARRLGGRLSVTGYHSLSPSLLLQLASQLGYGKKGGIVRNMIEIGRTAGHRQAMATLDRDKQRTRLMRSTRPLWALHQDLHPRKGRLVSKAQQVRQTTQDRRVLRPNSTSRRVKKNKA